VPSAPAASAKVPSHGPIYGDDDLPAPAPRPTNKLPTNAAPIPIKKKSTL
jgi:hypothetical protein